MKSRLYRKILYTLMMQNHSIRWDLSPLLARADTSPSPLLARTVRHGQAEAEEASEEEGGRLRYGLELLERATKIGEDTLDGVNVIWALKNTSKILVSTICTRFL